jgi:hypothetical protein
MVTLNAGNVLLKPSHRKQLMSWLRRTLRLGQRVADFALNITMQRTGWSAAWSIVCMIWACTAA